MEAVASPRQRWRELVPRLTSTPLIPVVVAVVLGLYRIGDKSFWLDEAYADPLDLSTNIEARDRVWLVQGDIPYDQVSDAVKQELSAFRVVEARDFGPDMVRVTLMERSQGPP